MKHNKRGWMKVKIINYLGENYKAIYKINDGSLYAISLVGRMWFSGSYFDRTPKYF